MIGNKIDFFEFETSPTKEAKTRTGIVVDVFTKVTGSVSGKSEHIFGFGEGSTTGYTDSHRMYTVEYYDSYDTKMSRPNYIDIRAKQMIKIIEFSGNYKTQELNEEKIVNG